MQILVTGGCSFSQIKTATDSKLRSRYTWPLFLQESLKIKEHYSDAVGAQGNDLISRQIVWQLSSLLKNYDPGDILVGIMWTNESRHSTLVPFSQRNNFDFHYGQGVELNDDTLYKSMKFYNPYSWDLENSSHAGWGILSPEGKLGEIYFRNFYNHEQSQIITLEHILRVQWLLKLHNIKYFMTTINDIFTLIKPMNAMRHLYNEIDFDHFLPIDGEYEWIKSQGLSFADDQGHPTAESHKAFVDQVVMPFLKEKKYIQ